MGIYTFDADADGFVNENANLVDENAYLDDDDVIEWVEGQFGDCWVKIYGGHERLKQLLNDDGDAVIEGIVCRVNAPGTHPGGNAYWLTPVEPVYVPVRKVEED